MELPQAIEELKVEYLGDSFAVVEAKKIAVAAIEKQIPKPVLVTKESYSFFCPCCYSDDEAIRYDSCAPYDYCTKCGQRLDWGRKEYIDERLY